MRARTRCAASSAAPNIPSARTRAVRRLRVHTGTAPAPSSPPALCLDKHGSGRCGLLRARWRRRARALRPKAPPWAPPPPAFTTFCMQAHTHTSVRGRRLGRRLGRRHHLRLLRWLRPFLPVPPARTPAHTHARMSSGSDHANDLVAHVLRGEGSSARLEQPPVGRRPAAHERTHAR